MKVMSRRARKKTITLYNYISTKNGVMTFQRTVIKKVYLDTSYAQRLSQRGVSVSDTAQLIIELRDIETTDNRTFIPYQEWKLLTDKTPYFTFSTTNDFFVNGDAPETLPTTTKKQMIEKYQYLSVSSVAIPIVGEVMQILGK